MIQYVRIAALLACVGLAVALYWQSFTISRLKDDNARLTRSVGALEGARDQAKAAAVIAKVEAARQRAKAEEYEQVKDAFRKGDYDAPLPDDFRVLLDRLLRGTRD